MVLDHYTKESLAFLREDEWAPPDDWRDHVNWSPCPASRKPADMACKEQLALHLFNHPHFSFERKLQRCASEQKELLLKQCRRAIGWALTSIATLFKQCLIRNSSRDRLPDFEDLNAYPVQPRRLAIDIDRDSEGVLQECAIICQNIPKRFNIRLEASTSNSPWVGASFSKKALWFPSLSTDSATCYSHSWSLAFHWLASRWHPNMDGMCSRCLRYLRLHAIMMKVCSG